MGTLTPYSAKGEDAEHHPALKGTSPPKADSECPEEPGDFPQHDGDLLSYRTSKIRLQQQAARTYLEVRGRKVPSGHTTSHQQPKETTWAKPVESQLF